MIKDLRHHLETELGFGVHYASITESEQRPCASLRRTLLDTHQALHGTNGFKVVGLALTIYADDYEELEDLHEQFEETYDGQRISLADGARSVKIYVEDADDEVYPAPEGGDGWIYARVIILRVHYKSKGKCRGRRSNNSKTFGPTG